MKVQDSRWNCADIIWIWPVIQRGLFLELVVNCLKLINWKHLINLETPPPAYMSEDGGSPRPDPNSMDADSIPPGSSLFFIVMLISSKSTHN